MSTFLDGRIVALLIITVPADSSFVSLRLSGLSTSCLPSRCFWSTKPSRLLILLLCLCPSSKASLLAISSWLVDLDHPREDNTDFPTLSRLSSKLSKKFLDCSVRELKSLLSLSWIALRTLQIPSSLLITITDACEFAAMLSMPLKMQKLRKDRYSTSSTSSHSPSRPGSLPARSTLLELLDNKKSTQASAKLLEVCWIFQPFL